MKIKLLPFEDAVKKAKEQGGILAQLTDSTEIIGITKEEWISLENKILVVHNKKYYYLGYGFYFPKCCCKVV